MTFNADNTQYYAGNYFYRYPDVTTRSGQNLSAQIALTGDCIGPFTIFGRLNAGFRFGPASQGYPHVEYLVDPATWTNIYYCRTTPIPPPPGGGGSGGGGEILMEEAIP